MKGHQRYVVIITGGLASGKDAVSAMLAERGAAVMDVDRIAKEEQENEEVLTQLVKEFGGDIVDVSGALDRRLLAQRAFANEGSVARLNAICWPPLQKRVDDFIRGDGLLIIQVPLLVESQAKEQQPTVSRGLRLIELADEIIAVVADENLRLERAITRGMNPQDARNRLALQASDEERVAISDTVFDNNKTLEDLQKQVIAWYEERTRDGKF